MTRVIRRLIGAKFLLSNSVNRTIPHVFGDFFCRPDVGEGSRGRGRRQVIREPRIGEIS